jgi:hypothetical protein
MANVLKKIFDPSIDEVVQNFTIQSWHVSQSVDAFTGVDDYDITISGSLVVTGSVAIHTLPNTSSNGVVLYDDATGLLYYTASSAFAVNNFYTSSISQSITSSVVNNNINNSTITQNITNSVVNNPAPSDQYIQYNSASAFGASVDFQFLYISSSLQQGNQNIASGQYSHAEGKGTISSGGSSHAEGRETVSSGAHSHAEGFRTSASFEYSHAEGQQTLANSPHSHAEGNQTQAAGTGSHAEGNTCTTVGNYSHAEGQQTFAQGAHSHAEGSSTTAKGIGTHAEGYYTFATGLYSHTEGAYSATDGAYSHAEGYLTTASANYSHAEGYWNVASGIYQHVQGQFNQTSSAQSAFIIGNGTSNTLRSNLVFASGSSFQVTGSVSLTQNLTVGGGYRPNTRITDSALDPTLLVTDHVVFIAPTSPGGIVYLPASPVTNMQLVIMRTEITSAFTVAPLGGFLINGLSSYIFPASAYTRKTFTFFGGRWLVESN